MDGGEVLGSPGSVVTPRKRSGVIDFKRQSERTTRSRPELQSGVGLAPAGDDRHDRPVAPPEDASKRLFVNATRTCRVTRMCVNPHSSELFRSATEINLPIEELGHRVVNKRDRDGRTGLRDKDELLNEQQIVGRRDPKPADFGVTRITQKQELGPRGRAEPQSRSGLSPHREGWWAFQHDSPRRGNG